MSKTFLDFIDDENLKKQILEYNKNNNSVNKINELEKKVKNLENNIKDLEEKLKEKERMLNKEKIKNDNLNQKLNKLKNKLDENNQNIQNYQKIISELKDEIKKFESKFLSPGEKLITIKIVSVDQTVNFIMTAKNTEKFSSLENILYDKFPKYKETENFFLVNGKKIKKYKTLEENKIKNKDVLTLTTIDDDEDN